MPIRDGRTLIDAADATTNFVEVGGGTMNLIADPNRIQGSNSVALVVSTSRDGILYDAGSPQDWSGNVFYIWWNITTSQLLSIQSVGGVTMRFCGATITDWFELFIAGSDTYGGGWVMSVVDIDIARALAVETSPSTDAATNGTPPATTAIQYVGIIADVPSMSKGVENLFVDALWRLPNADSPGIIVSDDNAGVPWTWQDIVDAGDINDTTKAWGTITQDDGVIKLNTPIQFGAAGSPNAAHDFEDTLVVAAWESQVVEDGFYGLTFVGDGTNAQRFVMGVNGSAGQGLTLLAASDGPRWFLDASDANIDNVGLYGCSFTHTSVIDVDHISVSLFDSLLIDGQRLHHSRLASPRSGADFQRNDIIAAVPIYGEGSPGALASPANIAYVHSADWDKIIDCNFNYFSGHAGTILEARDFDLVGNVFNGPWLALQSPDGQQTLDAALLNEVGDITISVSGGGNTPTYFDAQSPGTEIVNNINVTITDIQPGTEVRVFPVESPINVTEIAGIESVGSPTEFSFSASAGLVVRIVVFHLDYVLPPANEFTLTIPNTDTSFPISQIIDRNYLNP